ncbi:uncharacterized protein LOC127078596 [Lathyrus oleraceus]|uniref:uncharacterized protein LOC127078596 n=1 Tax=Pisum sativum TaxID=3888 RepID=UPI0021CF4D07|nr:uncharacterized protein LOC127078596 [Pisum sativum]
MSQPFVSTPRKSSKEKENPKNIGIEIDFSDVITDDVPLSIVHVHATPMTKARTSSSRENKPTKVSTSSTPSITVINMNDPEPPKGVNKPMSMTILYLDPISIEPNIGLNEDCSTMTNVMENVEASGTSNKPRTEDITNELSSKDKNLIDQPTDIVNIEELDSNDVPIGQRLAPGIAKRLKNRKGQVVGSSSTPSKSIKKKANVGPTKRWSKVVTHTPKKNSLKRKEVPSDSSESDQDVEHNVQDIISTSRKQASGKKIPANISKVPLHNISFHSVENVEKWKYVYQKRLELERELGKDAFECKEVLSLIQEAGLMKNATGFGKCYEMLVKEFIVNISKECDNKRRKEFRKVYVRGRCVYFSPEIINKFWEEMKKNNLKLKSQTMSSAKRSLLSKIGAANWVPTNHTSNIAIGLEKGGEEAYGTNEEEDNKDRTVTSDEEETSSDED